MKKQIARRTWSHQAVVTLIPARAPVVDAVLPGRTTSQVLRVESVSLHSTVIDSRCAQFSVVLFVSKAHARPGEPTETIRYSDTMQDEYTRPLARLPIAVADLLAGEPLWLDRLTTGRNTP